MKKIMMPWACLQRKSGYARNNAGGVFVKRLYVSRFQNYVESRKNIVAPLRLYSHGGEVDPYQRVEELRKYMAESSTTMEEKVDLSVELSRVFVDQLQLYDDALNVIHEQLDEAKDFFGPLSNETSTLYAEQRDICWKQGRIEEASRIQEVIVQIESHLLQDGVGNREKLIDDWILFGELQRNLGEFNNATTCLEKALKILGKSKDNHMYCDITLTYGKLFMDQKKHLQASQILQKLLNSLEQSDPSGWMTPTKQYMLCTLIAQNSMFVSDTHKAKIHYDRALKIEGLSEKDIANVRYHVAVLLDIRKEFYNSYIEADEVLQMYKDIITENGLENAPDSQFKIEMLYMLAKTYTLLGNILFKLSQDGYLPDNTPREKLGDLKFNPEIMRTTLKLTKKQCRDKALIYFQTALEYLNRNLQINSTTDLAFIYDVLAQIMNDNKEYSEAHAYHRKAFLYANQIRQHAPLTYPNVLYHMGIHYFLQKRYDDAINHLEEALEEFKNCYPKSSCYEMGEIFYYLAYCWDEIWETNNQESTAVNAKLCSEQARNILSHHSDNLFDIRLDEMVLLRRKHLNVEGVEKLKEAKKTEDEYRSKGITKEDDRAREMRFRYADETQHDYISRGHELVLEKHRSSINAETEPFEQKEIRMANEQRREFLEKHGDEMLAKSKSLFSKEELSSMKKELDTTIGKRGGKRKSIKSFI